MFTFRNDEAIIKKRLLVYVAVTLLVAVFGGIYEFFSHEVYSFFMIYAFVIPLTLGVLPLAVINAANMKMPAQTGYDLWNCGVAALTTGCVFKGVLDIFGTTNRLLVIYPAVGAAFIAAGILTMILFRRKTGKENGYEAVDCGG